MWLDFWLCLFFTFEIAMLHLLAMIEIKLSKCILRPWKASDLDSLVENANNPNIARFLRNLFPHPYTRKDGEEWIERISAMEKPNILSITVDGKGVGGIGIHPMSDVYFKNAEIGYWLGETHWNKGILSEAVPAMVKHAFENYDITRIYAGIYSPNLASMRVLEKSGFTKEAILKKSVFKNGEYLDEHVYALLKEDWVNHLISNT